MKITILLLISSLALWSCRQQGGVRDLLAEKSSNGSEGLTDQQRQSGILLRAYFPEPGEVKKDCTQALQGLAYIESNRTVMECKNGQYTVAIKQFAVGELLKAGRVYEIGIDNKILQELKVQYLTKPIVAACQSKENFEKEVSHCVPVIRNTDNVYGKFREVVDCMPVKTFEGVSWSAPGSVSVVGPSAVSATVTCNVGETQAQAIQRGSIVSACPVGSFSGSLGLCIPCQAGSYQDQVAQTSCKACTNQINQATAVVYSTADVGLVANACTVSAATCAVGFEYSAVENVCSPIGTLVCPPGKQESAGTCINCPPGTFKALSGAESCTSCTNNILYGQSPVYSLLEFGLTSNTCSVSSSSCISGFTYNALSKVCEATSFVGSYTNPAPPASLQVCQGSVTTSGSLLACYNMVGDLVSNSLCAPTGDSQIYTSPAGTIDAESNGLLLGLVRDAGRVQEVRQFCATGSASKMVESSNFLTLLNANELQVSCQEHFADPFLQSSNISCRSQIKRIAGATSSTCGLLENGKLFCWGIQQNGVVGNGVNSTAVYVNANFPRNITQVCKNSMCTEKLEGVIELVANNSHTCAIDSQNNAYCWGSNANGRLGDGTTTVQTIATPVAGGYKFIKISAGANHTCGIEAITKKVLCWGLNTNGELGYGAFNATATNLNGTLLSPTHYVTTSALSTDHLTEVHDIELGDAFSCAIVGVDRRLFCWGRGANGRTGLNTTALRSFASPIKIDYASDIAMSGVQQISARSTHACAIVGNNRALYCWGNGANMRLGNASTANQQVPQLISTPETPHIVSVGVTSTCFSSLDGNVFCVGRNNGGQLGYGTHSTTTGNPDNEKSTYQQVLSAAALGVTGLFSGAEFHCALDQNKIPNCWGTNLYRQLNDNSTTLRSAPVKMDFF